MRRSNDSMLPERPIPSSGSPLNPISGNGPKSKPAIPDHELIRCIGEGAYGEVWLARNVLGAYRAVKIVYRKSFREERTYEREFRGIQQFEPISRTNDGLLDILQAGRNDGEGYYYYVMELADPVEAEEKRRKGEGGQPEISHAPFPPFPPAPGIIEPDTYIPKTLGHILGQRGRLPPMECVQLGLNLTLALGHLHRHKLIHRDIKPANIIFVQGIPKLADIGLVTNFDDTCSFVGTEGFIAPEGPTSPRADLYSLGKVLYEISTGRDRKDFPEPATGFGEQPLTPALSPSEGEREKGRGDTSAELNAIILKACAASAQDRYQTAEELHADLALLNSGKSVMWKRVVEKRLAFARKAGAVVGIIALLAFGGYLYQRHQTREAKRLQQIAEDLVALRDIQHAETLLDRGESSLALAHLAQVLRRHPDNRVAAERIMAALTQRNFPRLTTQPLKHQARLITAHFSPDSQSVVSASEDNAVRLWNVQTGGERISPVRHLGPVNSVEFNPNGSRILTASDDGTALVMDALRGVVVLSLKHGSPVYAATFSPNGEWIATADDEGKVRCFKAATGELHLSSIEHTNPVNTVVFSPDGQWFATGTDAKYGLIQIWETGSNQLKHRILVKGPVHLLRFSGDGKRLAATVRNHEATDVKKDWLVYVWDVESGLPMIEPLVHDHPDSLAFGPNGQQLVTADIDNLARVWDLATGKILFELRHSESLNSVAFSPDGRYILTASSDLTARVWDAATGAAISEPLLHDGKVIHAEFSRDNERVLTVGREDKTVKLWSVRSDSPANKRLQHKYDGWVVSAEFDKSGGEAITTTRGEVFSASAGGPYHDGGQQGVIIWDVATGASKFAPPIPTGNEAFAARFAETGPKALIVDRTGDDEYGKHAWILDLEKGTPVGEKIHLQAEITCADFTANGHKLATGSKDGMLMIWDGRHGTALTPPLTNQGRLKSIRFSPNGAMLVTASENGTAMIWDVSMGRRLAGPLRHDAGVWFAQFSPGSDKVVTVSRDYTAKLWSTNGAPIATFRHSAPVEYAEFSPDGTKVVTASGDRTARIWSVTTGKQLAELQHAGLVMTARFSPDGLRVITASKDGTAQVWDAITGLRLADPFRHGAWVTSASFSPDGRRAIAASMDKAASIWEVPLSPSPIPSWLPELAEAVGGRRLNLDRIPEPVSWADHADLKARLTKAPASDPYIQWASRLFSHSTALGVDADAINQPTKPSRQSQKP